MSRRVLFAALAILSVASASRLALAAPPSVLLISVDTLRADRLGSYGYGRNTSPRMDDLLARGARFSQARTVEPLTAPALISMITGLDPHEHAASRNGLRMRPDLVSFSQIFKRRGYETAALVGNWTLRDRLSGLGEHFEEYVEVLDKPRWFGLFKGEATAADLTDRALAWLAERSDEGGTPYLLWVHYVEPHAPYLLQREFESQVGSPEKGSPGADRRHRYDTEIAFVDHHIGLLVDGAAAQSGGEDLVTVLVADHGESLGEHDYWGHGRHLFDATLHIPMGIVWPGRIEPAVVDAPALITDLAPTLLGLAGLPVPGFYAGHDWGPTLLAGEAPDGARVTHYQAHRGAVQRRDAPHRVREQGLLEVARLEGGRKEILRVTNGRRWVFDVLEDPSEARPDVSQNFEASDELKEWWRQVRVGLVQSDELPPASIDDADLEALRALGYID